MISLLKQSSLVFCSSQINFEFDVQYNQHNFNNYSWSDTSVNRAADDDC